MKRRGGGRVFAETCGYEYHFVLKIFYEPVEAP